MKFKKMFFLLSFIMLINISYADTCDEFIYRGDKYLAQEQYNEAAQEYFNALKEANKQQCLQINDFYYFLSEIGFNIGKTKINLDSKKNISILATKLQKYVSDNEEFLKNLQYEIL
jgi:outer membrane protein OmpA-like peptidoglycan-associated protein